MLHRLQVWEDVKVELARQGRFVLIRRERMGLVYESSKPRIEESGVPYVRMCQEILVGLCFLYRIPHMDSINHAFINMVYGIR